VLPLTAHAHDDVAIAAAWSLGRLGGTDAETTLIELLTAPRSVSVRRAAVESLAAIGGPAALAALRRCERGIFAKRELRRAARDAITAIESRAGSRDGALALTSPPGELSLADGDSEG
jgi:HEAT repeat protein